MPSSVPEQSKSLLITPVKLGRSSKFKSIYMFTSILIAYWGGWRMSRPFNVNDLSKKEQYDS